MVVRSCHAIVLTLAFCSITVTGAEPHSHALGEGQIDADVVYGHKDGLALTMDIYTPTAEANDAAVVFIVSGGWYSRWSPPEQQLGLFAPFLSKGYRVFAVRHGSSPRYGIPDAVADVTRAIRFIHLHSSDYAIDPSRIGVMGMSAGGHLSLMLATNGDDGQPDANDPVLRSSSRVTTVAALVPPTDLTVCVWEAEESLPQYRSFPALELSVEEARKVSPKFLVSEDDATALIISGGKDELVPPRHGEWIAAEYEAEGLKHKFIVLDANHGLAGKREEAFQAIYEWFDSELLSN